MAGRNFKIRVIVHQVSGVPGIEDKRLNHVVAGPDEDRARALAKVYLEQEGLTVLGLAHGPDDVIVARVMRKPPKQPTLIAGGVK